MVVLSTSLRAALVSDEFGSVAVEHLFGGSLFHVVLTSSEGESKIIENQVLYVPR